MSAHAKISVETGIPAFFADPQSPWQRGTNENTKGLLRQHFPKGTDLSCWPAEEIAAVAHALNTRPRKTLGWRTPAEALNEHPLLLQQSGVASTVEPGQISVLFRRRWVPLAAHQTLPRTPQRESGNRSERAHSTRPANRLGGPPLRTPASMVDKAPRGWRRMVGDTRASGGLERQSNSWATGLHGSQQKRASVRGIM